MTESVNAPKPRFLPEAASCFARQRSRPGRRSSVRRRRIRDQAERQYPEHRRVRSERAAADGLCRHRREGEAGGDFGAREGEQRAPDDGPAKATSRSSPARRWSASSAASADAMACRRAARPAAAAAASVTGQGSGFFISADGYAVTNNHVVDGADKVEVTARRRQDLHRQGDRHRSAHRSRADQGRRPQRLPVRASCREGKPRIGDWVLAVGNPFGLGGTVTAGIVSARGRDIGTGPYDDFIQIDAPVNKGNSGGPAFNVDGEVIGVNTAIYSPSGGSVGIAFAIPADTVKTRGRPAQGQGQRQPRLDRRADPAGDAGDRRQPRPEEGRRRAGGRAAGGRPGGQGRHRVRRRHHRGQRRAGQGCARTRPHHRRPRARHCGEAQRAAQGPGQGRQPDARPVAERSKAKADADRNGRRQLRRGTDVPKLGLTLAPAGSVAGAGKEGVVVTEVDPERRRRRARLQGRRRHSRSRRQERRQPGEVREAIAAARNGQQEQRADAREDRRLIALRRGAAGQGLIDQACIEMERIAGIRRPRRRSVPGDGLQARPRPIPPAWRSSPPSVGRS